jgi:hypothetical protein
MQLQQTAMITLLIFFAATSPIIYGDELPKGKEVPGDFAWILRPALKTTDQVVWAKEFESLLPEIVPDCPGKPHAKSRRKRPNLREWVKLNLGGPPGDKQIRENRYVLIAACRAHSCGDEGPALDRYKIDHWPFCRQ